MTTETPTEALFCLYCGERPQHSRGRCATCYARARKADPSFARHYTPGALCSLCLEPAHACGLCQMHYMRAYRHGDATVVLRGGWSSLPRQTTCEMCDGDYYARGLCRSHYEKARRRGLLEVFVR